MSISCLQVQIGVAIKYLFLYTVLHMGMLQCKIADVNDAVQKLDYMIHSTHLQEDKIDIDYGDGHYVFRRSDKFIAILTLAIALNKQDVVNTYLNICRGYANITREPLDIAQRYNRSEIEGRIRGLAFGTSLIPAEDYRVVPECVVSDDDRDSTSSEAPDHRS